jgi:hypothetical protein
MGAHGAAQALPATAGGLVAHQFIDCSSRDAGVLQPGGERVAEVMGAVEVDGVQERVAWSWERRPATDLLFVGWSDQAGCGELIERALLASMAGSIGMGVPLVPVAELANPVNRPGKCTLGCRSGPTAPRCRRVGFGRSPSTAATGTSPALLRLVSPRHTELATAGCRQITNASSSNATATRRATGSSTASS